ncbi:MAG TPA: DNA alkylation repair protein, partial [Actinomycetes bacterium]|nr:DNA alkylation repair protein [Actinomycetes bacterium]
MSGAVDGLVDQIRHDLADNADPERAAQQQAYMKSSMPHRGVTLPQVRTLTKAALRDYPLTDQSELVAAVSTLWDDAEYREEWYAALTVLQVPKHRRWRDVTLLP